jgi:hypothetical protein
MKPADKERLVKARPDLVRSLDVQQVLPLLKRPEMYTQEDEAKIMSDPRRRERMMLFLTIMERKSCETYQAFCEILEARFPHLFLLLSDWDDDDSLPNKFTGTGSDARVDDEWAMLHRYRPYLISQIDAAKIATSLRDKNVLTVEQEQLILNDPEVTRRTETFLDFLEMKPPGTYPVFVEAVGEIYPHVYLTLITDGNDDEW